MAGPTVLSAAGRARCAGILITAALDERPHRAPDFAAENHALHRLAQALTASNGAVLQTLADMALTLCGAGIAGIGLCSEGVLWVHLGCGISKTSEKNWIRADAVQSQTPRRSGAQA